MNWLSSDVLVPVAISVGIFLAVIVFFAYMGSREEHRNQEERIRKLEEKLKQGNPSQ